MRNIQTTQNATATLFANNVLEESFEADPLSDLQRILEQVQELNQKYNTKDEQKLHNNKFTTNSCSSSSDSDSDIEHYSSNHRHSLKTIDVSLNDSGELNLDNLRTEINNAENEYNKIRVPSDVDLRDIDLRVEDSDCENKNNNNNEQKKRTRNREKTIAEYFV